MFRTRGHWYAIALTTALQAVGCIPQPAALQAELAALVDSARVAAQSHKTDCSTSLGAAGQNQRCSELVTCLVKLQAAAGECQGAVSIGQTASDSDYGVKAKACIANGLQARSSCTSKGKGSTP